MCVLDGEKYAVKSHFLFSVLYQ